MIEADRLTKRFDDFVAVRDVSLVVHPGEVLALLGPNGAGKTTTVRMLASILAPTSGRARVAGFDVVAEPRRVRQHVGLLTEHHGLYLRMRGDEYLDFFGELQGMPAHRRRQRAQELMARFGLDDAAQRPLSEYSKGMRQKLALVRSLLHDPPVLLLDEPTSAMDPFSAKQVRDCITDLRKDGRTILLCTHNLTEAEQLAGGIAIIRRGEVVVQGRGDELKDRLLGPPLLELRLAHPVDGLADVLRRIVTVHSAGPDWVRYRADARDWATVNPRLLEAMAEREAQVVTLSEVPRSLEEVYLRAVGQSEGAPPPTELVAEEVLV